MTFLADHNLLAFAQQWRWERVLYGFLSLDSLAQLVALGFTPEHFQQAEDKTKAFEEGGKKVIVKTLSLKRVPADPPPSKRR